MYIQVLSLLFWLNFQVHVHVCYEYNWRIKKRYDIFVNF
jgi:hypothetical protein